MFVQIVILEIIYLYLFILCLLQNVLEQYTINRQIGIQFKQYGLKNLKDISCISGFYNITDFTVGDICLNFPFVHSISRDTQDCLYTITTVTSENKTNTQNKTLLHSPGIKSNNFHYTVNTTLTLINSLF